MAMGEKIITNPQREHKLNTSGGTLLGVHSIDDIGWLIGISFFWTAKEISNRKQLHKHGLSTVSFKSRTPPTIAGN